jgi:hypothetical protein
MFQSAILNQKFTVFWAAFNATILNHLNKRLVLHMTTRILQAFAALLLMFMFNPAQADLILGLRFDNNTTSKNVTSGETVFVDLTLSDTDGSTLFPAEGLLTGGGRLMQTGGAASLLGTAVQDIQNLWATGGISTSPGSAGGVNEIAKMLGATDVFLGPAAGKDVVLGTSSTITIARFAVQVTGALGQTAQISSDILGGGTDGFSTFDTFSILDGSITSFGSVDLTITGLSAVPEPGTMLLGGLTAMGGGIVAWRRRRVASR